VRLSIGGGLGRPYCADGLADRSWLADVPLATGQADGGEDSRNIDEPGGRRVTAGTLPSWRRDCNFKGSVALPVVTFR